MTSELWEKVPVVCRVGWEETDGVAVEGWRRGPFAVHPSHAYHQDTCYTRRWNLTHVPSGLRFACSTDGEVLLAVADMLSHPDWTRATTGTPAMLDELRSLRPHVLEAEDLFIQDRGCQWSPGEL